MWSDGLPLDVSALWRSLAALTLAGVTLAGDDDNLNLRCFNQKQRFGIDLLYPTERYVSGFGDGTVPLTGAVGLEATTAFNVTLSP